MPAARYIIRVANTDLNGEKKIKIALCKIKGVSKMFANAICVIGKINPDKKAGDLSDDEERKLNDILRAPQQAGVPEWMLNRRKDPETGEDFHIVGSDVAYSKENDIKRLKKIKTYKGLRHAVGLPVRGQRTKSHFRKNRKKQVGKKARADTPQQREQS